MTLPIYIDIDGTLTAEDAINAPAIPDRLKRVAELVYSGREVVIWSARGTSYARDFCERNNIIGVTVIGKPDFLIDDNPTIRPVDRMPVIDPSVFFGRPE